MSTKLRCAVIGVGNMGMRHARIYAAMPDVELVALVDVKQEVCLDAVNIFHCGCYSDFKDMLSSRKPNLVSICVPTILHHQIGRECILQGVHCLIEKPLASKLDEAENLVSLAFKKGVTLLTGHIERFNPVVLKVKEIIDSGQLGNIISIIARRVGPFPPQIKDVDVAVDLAIHDIDIVNYLLDKTPDFTTVIRQIGLIKDRADAVSFFLRYGRVVAFIQANWITPLKIRQLSVTGDKGYLEMDYLTQKIKIYQSQIQPIKPEVNFQDFVYKFSSPEITTIALPPEEPLRKEIEFFIQHIRSGKPIDNSFAIESLRIALKQNYEK